jgi:hypothetical protein
MLCSSVTLNERIWRKRKKALERGWLPRDCNILDIKETQCDAYSPTAGSCERSNERSGIINAGNLLIMKGEEHY